MTKLLSKEELAGFEPIISIKFACIPIFPASPSAIVSDLIKPPFSILNELVAIEILPAFPSASVEVDIIPV